MLFPKGTWFGGKNYLKIYFQGVFNGKAWWKRSCKSIQKGFVCFCLNKHRHGKPKTIKPNFNYGRN